MIAYLIINKNLIWGFLFVIYLDYATKEIMGHH